ncbi:unnamed protein product [Boreogadus saida]
MLQVTLGAAILNSVSEFFSVTTEFNRDGEFAVRGKGKGCGASEGLWGPKRESLWGHKRGCRVSEGLWGPKRVCGASVGPQKGCGASEGLRALRGSVGPQMVVARSDGGVR